MARVLHKRDIAEMFFRPSIVGGSFDQGPVHVQEDDLTIERAFTTSDGTVIVEFNLWVRIDGRLLDTDSEGSCAYDTVSVAVEELPSGIGFW